MDENMDNQTPPSGNPSQPNEPQTPPQPETPPVGQPQTDFSGDLTKDAKMWGMLCHLTALAGYVGIPFGNILGPLIVWLVKKDEFEFVKDQGKESLNFQISMSIYAIISGVLMCIGIGIVLLIAVALVNLIFIIIATIESNKGKLYRYPLCIRLIK
jgi:hypothetical protein